MSSGRDPLIGSTSLTDFKPRSGPERLLGAVACFFGAHDWREMNVIEADQLRNDGAAGFVVRRRIGCDRCVRLKP